MRVVRRQENESELAVGQRSLADANPPIDPRLAALNRSPETRRSECGARPPKNKGDSPWSDERVARSEIDRLQTEVERLRNELFLTREDLRRLRREARVDASTRLIDALGHELRTSLTLMLGWTELLVAGSLPPDKHGQVFESIYAAGWRIEAALRWLERTSDKKNPLLSKNHLHFGALSLDEFEDKPDENGSSGRC